MALIICPECQRPNVSDTASACPSCGFGIKAYFDKVKVEAEQKKKAAEQVEQKRLEQFKIKQAIQRRDALEALEEKEETEKMLASIKIPKKRGIGIIWFLLIILSLTMFVICFFLSSLELYLPDIIQKSKLFTLIQSSIHNDIIMGKVSEFRISPQELDYSCIVFGIISLLMVVFSQISKRRKNKDFYSYKDLGDAKYRQQKLKESGWVSEVSKRREERRQQELQTQMATKKHELNKITPHIYKEPWWKKHQTLIAVLSVVVAWILLILLISSSPAEPKSNKCMWCGGTGSSYSGKGLPKDAMDFYLHKVKCSYCGGTGRIN